VERRQRINLGRCSSKNSQARDINDAGHRVACDETFQTFSPTASPGSAPKRNVGLEVTGKPRSISDIQGARGHVLIAYDSLKKLGVP
jgi:hypothetical protein